MNKDRGPEPWRQGHKTKYTFNVGDILYLVKSEYTNYRKYDKKIISPVDKSRGTRCRKNIAGRHLLNLFYNKEGERCVVCQRCKKYVNVDNPTSRQTKSNIAFRKMAENICNNHNYLFNVKSLEL